MDAAAHHPQQGDFRVTLLGTGSPRPSLTRHHPAAFVQWGEGGHMLVDAGDGVVSQLLAAGIASAAGPPLAEMPGIDLGGVADWGRDRAGLACPRFA